MTQQQIKSDDHDPSFGPTPTWHEVYSYWQSKGVPQIEVISFDPDVHDEGISWFERNLSFNDRRGYFHVLRETPKVDTARALARTVSKGGPSLYAAFALMTTLRDLDQWTPLEETVREHLDQISPDICSYWHPNSKRVLPCTVDGRHTFSENRDWHLRVDLAARVWTELAAQFQVVRQPLWT